MGKCWSCFRATFTPNEEGNDRTRIPLKPAVEPVTPISPVSDDTDRITENIIFIRSVNLLATKNAASHHTDDFPQINEPDPKLVIRRGFPFKVKVDLSREYNRDKDTICFIFSVKGVPNPSVSKRTLVVAPVISSGETSGAKDWQAVLESSDENSITVEITSACDAIVGQWSLDIDSKLKRERENDSTLVQYKHPQPVYLLFNPWCEKDGVYMENEKWKREYVLADTGLIWRGSYNSLRPCIWNFGQFETDILEACCFLLTHVGKLSTLSCADPVAVSRHVSAVVNSPDDHGVLVGNWSGDFSGGTKPTAWAGSVKILQQYYKTKKPVKFGQCWVFSGVCTTVLRTLGIPSRSVTNFQSAHDTQKSLTLDYFFDDDGKPVERLNTDSVWNFHVWNESWMTRPDLEPGDYSGWQVIDSTPQEKSNGKYQLGPASVAAIKRGEVKKAFDADFVFAEVNADKVYWRYYGNSRPLKLINRSTETIGQFISTKAIGKFEREDITANYKFDEYTKEERAVMLSALRESGNVFSRYYLNDEFEDVQFDFKLLDDIVIGSPFTVKLVAKNKNKEGKEYSLKVALWVASILYTGQAKKTVKNDQFVVRLKAGTEEEMIMNIEYKDYEKLLIDQSSFTVAALASVVETEFDYFAQDDFRVRMPDVKLETEGELALGSSFTVIASLKNPLPKPLNKCYFVLEGPGLAEPMKLPVKGKIASGAVARVTCQMKPKLFGQKTIIAKFYSKELYDIDGFKEILVKGPAVEEKIEENVVENGN